MTTITPKYHLSDIFNPQTAHPDDAHSILMRLIPAGAQVLELGCASGYLSGYMEQSLGCRVTGLEADADAVAIAKTRATEVYQVDLDADDALEPAMNSAPYNVILAAAVLEHLKYPERLLQQFHTMMAPDATLIVSLPNVANWRVRLNLLMGRFDYTDYGIMDRTHLRLYTLKTGRELLEQNGYTVTAVHIAGSGLQNQFNALARRMNRPQPSLILPGLFAYELIYVAQTNK